MKRRTARAFAATKFSVLALRPASPQGRSAINWYTWDDFAKKNGLLNKRGEPSLSKVKMLIKHHVLSATKSKCLPTFHRINNQTGEQIFRNQSRIVVTERTLDQLEWTPEDWYYQWRGLFGRSQSGKAKHKRK
jgi:hypothetical protein